MWKQDWLKIEISIKAIRLVICFARVYEVSFRKTKDFKFENKRDLQTASDIQNCDLRVMFLRFLTIGLIIISVMER